MNALVLTVFGMRLGSLGCYGNEWIATPNLDRLAAEGVTFDQHFGAEIGVTPPCDTRWLAKAKRLGPVEGVVRVVGPNLAPPWTLPDDELALYCEDEGTEPWPDPPTTAPDDVDERRRIQDTYAAVLTRFDADLGVWLDGLRERGELDRCVVVVAGVQGLALGEHGTVGTASPDLHEEHAHLPLVARFPYGEFGGTRVALPTQPQDLERALTGVGPGFDLFALARGMTDDARPYAVTVRRAGERVVEASLRSPEWAVFVAGDRTSLYAKPDDRWEANDVAGRLPDFADAMRAALDAALADPTRFPPLPAFGEAPSETPA